MVLVAIAAAVLVVVFFTTVVVRVIAFTIELVVLLVVFLAAGRAAAVPAGLHGAGPSRDGRTRRWQVVGFRASGRRCDAVAQALREGGPPPA